MKSLIKFFAWMIILVLAIPTIVMMTTGILTIVLVLFVSFTAVGIIGSFLNQHLDPPVDPVMEKLDILEDAWAEKYGMGTAMMMRSEIEASAKSFARNEMSQEEFSRIVRAVFIKYATKPLGPKSVPKINPDLKTLGITVLPATERELRAIYVQRAKMIRTDLTENHALAVSLNTAYTRLKRSYS